MSKKPVVNLSDVQLRDFASNGGKFEAKLARIGGKIGAKKLGCMLHVVKPGKKAFPLHAHHVNEEMYLVLKGEGTYQLGDETYAVKKNDMLAAPAGDESTAHQLSNTGSEDLHYLCFSTRQDPDVVEYPNSGKFAVMSMIPEDKGGLSAGLSYIGRQENSLDYFDGEDDA